ncbi:discoidin domain-containing receptor 2 isoform X1 [Megalopta genalis]|uniref:discoidin domain-containing receptor 2 isoform X1 n=2 Tax=Megalopta genalis TaxID=115081 RepID=UPI003FD17704
MSGSDVKMRRALLTVVSLVMLVAGYSPPMEDSTRNVFGECILPLGMEEGKIPDDAITASSSYESKSVGPQNARIRQEKNGGAWCPKAQISSAIREYLEIDLTRNHLIAWTETQGRFGNGQGQEFAEAFFLEYWRDTKWHQYKNLKGDRVLRGNSNTYLVEKQKLDLPFVASRVRFVPYSKHPRTVCMRVEIYGCLWDQYVVRYVAPRGTREGPGGCNVEDSSYDGDKEPGPDSSLVNGLGQLTDGILGELSELLSSTATATNWVGWTDRETVQFLFEFQELREFENCSIHVARLPELEVEMFSRLRIWFSTDGDDYQTNPDISETIPIDVNDAISTVLSTSIPLRSKTGRFVKLELDFAGKWLLLSEITFHTVSIIENRLVGSYTSIDRSFGEDRNQSELWRKLSELETTMSDLNETDIYKILKDDDSTLDAFPVASLQTYVGLVSGLLTVIVLFLTCTAFLIKQRGRNKVALLQKHTALLCDSSAPGIAINPKDVKIHSSIVNGLSLIRKPIIITMATSASGTLNSASTTTATTTPAIAPATATVTATATATATAIATATTAATATATTTTSDTAAIINNALVETDSTNTQADQQSDRSRANSQAAGNQPHRASVVYEKTCQLLPDEDFILAGLNISPRTSESCTDFKCKISNFTRNKSTEFALPAPAVAETKKPTHYSVPGKTVRKVHEGYYAATDILTIKRRELSSTVSPFTPLHIREKGGKAIITRTLDTRNIRRISRHRLRILDMLGEGNFGLVHLCEAKGIASPNVGSVQNRQTVIVRSLWRGVVDSLRIDFTKDMRVLATLRDPHVARMLALVEEEPFGAVFEYSELGDLPTFFQSRSTFAENETTLSYNDRLNFARQIASGMKYLESVKIPHCDLAARNCIVGQNLTIKVSDHAMFCSKYDHHYYMDAYNGKIPLRWMAWEAVILSTRSCRADIWSFAVTIWEILTSCTEIPYSHLTSEQVLENHNRWYQGNADGNGTGTGNGLINVDEKYQPRVLPRPNYCSDDLYRVMNECWSKRTEDRPTFEEMNRYLEKLAHV